MSPFRDLVQDELPAAMATRHDLHAHPELGYKETRTSGVVQKHLAALGIDFKAGVAGGTGVLGWIPATTGAQAARTIALRADMDALPIHENTGVVYQSATPGIMHACGHDGHTTILMTAASLLKKLPERQNNVLLVFQPAEEGGAGGEKMCIEGALRGAIIGQPADAIFGLHGFPNIPVGHVTTRNGPLLAAASQFLVHIKGKGAHAAQPNAGIDPIVIAAHIITALQTIASRSVSPVDSVVVTIGQVVAGVAHNVIPETAKLSGTLRALNDVTNELGKRRIGEISESIASAFGGSATVEWIGAYPVTLNDPTLTDEFRRVASRVLGSEFLHEEEHPTMGGEDFSFYGREIPASFFFLGLLPEGQDKYPNLHSPEFDFNDSAIPAGVQLMCELALSR